MVQELLKFLGSWFLNFKPSEIFLNIDRFEEAGFVDWNDVIADNFGFQDIIVDFNPLEGYVKKRE